MPCVSGGEPTSSEADAEPPYSCPTPGLLQAQMCQGITFKAVLVLSPSHRGEGVGPCPSGKQKLLCAIPQRGRKTAALEKPEEQMQGPGGLRGSGVPLGREC